MEVCDSGHLQRASLEVGGDLGEALYCDLVRYARQLAMPAESAAP